MWDMAILATPSPRHDCIAVCDIGSMHISLKCMGGMFGIRR